jgi:cobalt/nickel transport system ATP-binding protein
MNPDVLLFDEPTAALDPRTSVWLLELLDELHRAGKTIVLATHDLDGLERVADRCAVFGEDHTVVAEGAPAEILADTALLLGVNLVHEHSHWHRGEPEPHTHPHAAAGHHHQPEDVQRPASDPASDAVPRMP